MEDKNTFAADCIVISCCCQCLILQIIIFVLLKLPSKMIRKAKRYVKKLRNKKREEKIREVEICRCKDGSSSRALQIDDDFCCMDEVEKQLDEFLQNGEFAFGSFWRGDVSRREFSVCQTRLEVDYDCFHHHLVETFGTFVLSSSSSSSSNNSLLLHSKLFPMNVQ